MLASGNVDAHLKNWSLLYSIRHEPNWHLFTIKSLSLRG